MLSDFVCIFAMSVITLSVCAIAGTGEVSDMVKAW